MTGSSDMSESSFNKFKIILFSLINEHSLTLIIS